MLSNVFPGHRVSRTDTEVVLEGLGAETIFGGEDATGCLQMKYTGQKHGVRVTAWVRIWLPFSIGKILRPPDIMAHDLG